MRYLLFLIFIFPSLAFADANLQMGQSNHGNHHSHERSLAYTINRRRKNKIGC